MIQMLFMVCSLLAQAEMPLGAPLAKTPPTPKQAAATQKDSPDVIIIDPIARAKDWVDAYQYLLMHAVDKTISFKLSGGIMLNNISSIEVLPGGTLLSFRQNTPMGITYKIAKVEDIMDIVQN